MKKKVFSIGAVAAFASAMAFNVNLGLNSQSKTDIILKAIEALATTETKCTTTSGTKTGICKEKINGKGDSCVEPGFWDTKDCDGEVEI